MFCTREYLRPRLCVLEKGSNGYGFHLHGEKGQIGQFVRLVEPDSPSEKSGLRAGDRLVFVNGESVETESHQQVVSRIRATTGRLELIVVDVDTDEYLKKYNMRCLREYVTQGIPLPNSDPHHGSSSKNGIAKELAPSIEKNGDVLVGTKQGPGCDRGCKRELRPRLCVMTKGADGYGFNLHSVRSKPGQYIRVVDEDSPAQRSGLLPKDKIVQVNGVPVEGKQHSEVVSAIREEGNTTSLLVVDPDTDAFFQRCRVQPTEAHLTGPLPRNGELDEEVNGKVSKENTKETKLSASQSPSSSALTTPPTRTPPREVTEDLSLGFNLSLQQVKERVHQKRSNKRAPQMDWSKKNELFSNL
ncbi:hypothetical protein MATL_G00212190 [Megalops atlanticus]|uniref:Na(+)/H(+) exchange regulatory cofactor NHE-RF n=1 Tax=Megalops atlanticus TaxID=7932 RepID=A0A9D3PKP4_MEGAT|nr:hypothetical protein MATL_G00212190 [Megalops atlanticus]